MGALEESGKAVIGVVDALKSSPLMLVILIINCAVIGFLFFSEIKQAQRAHEISVIVKDMFTSCLQRSGVKPGSTSGQNVPTTNP